MFCKSNLVLNGNSGTPDQTPRLAASDLGLHCLPMSFLCDARYELIKVILDVRRVSSESLLRIGIFYSIE